MCDASDYPTRVVFVQRKDKLFRSIYYTSTIWNDAQENYTTNKNEMLAIMLANEKFKAYILGTHFLIHIDHATKIPNV